MRQGSPQPDLLLVLLDHAVFDRDVDGPPVAGLEVSACIKSSGLPINVDEPDLQMGLAGRMHGSLNGIPRCNVAQAVGSAYRFSDSAVLSSCWTLTLISQSQD